MGFNTFYEFAAVLTLASVLGYIVSRLKLPLVVAYLVTGILVSVFISTLHLPHLEIFTSLPNIGIAFVLFLIGMELDLRELKALGKPIIISSLTQIVISALAGFTISALFGFNQIESFLLGIGLSFSSTIVIIKMLLEKRDLASLYGKLSVGILLIEDLTAIAVLMLISMGSSNFQLGIAQSIPFIILVAKALLLFVLTYLLAKFVLGPLFESIARSAELLFLSALTWCFLFASLAQMSGFSVTIGAFLAGIALATSPYHYQIQGRIKPLRDFFVTLFFVYLGTQVQVGDIFKVWPLIIIFTLYALILKPFIFLLVLGAFGFRKHTIYQAAFNLSQISEFSLVILLLGVKMGIVPPITLSIMAGVAVLSVMFSSVLIAYSKKLYKYFSRFIEFFERKEMTHYMEQKLEKELFDHVIVIGAHRVGGPIVDYLKNSHIPFVVMDFNPHIVERLREEGINVIYGDIGDPDILDSLQLEKAKLIVSTATEIQDNELLLAECARRGVKAKIVARSLDEAHAKLLKKLGAEYVILPEKVSGDFLVHQIKTNWPHIHFSGLS